MMTSMTPRARLVLLAVAAMAALLGLLVVDGTGLNDAPSSRTGVVGVIDRTDALIATPATSQPVLAAIRGVPLSVVFAAAPLTTHGRLRSMTGLPFRLDDVGHDWRALLLGAPPVRL